VVVINLFVVSSNTWAVELSDNTSGSENTPVRSTICPKTNKKKRKRGEIFGTNF
jgi:hypothetical protein